MKKIITIDGPAGAGKSTLSRLIAKKLDLIYLDTGAMYRAVALRAARNGIDFSKGRELYGMCVNLDLNFKQEGGCLRVFIGKEDVSSAIRRPEMDMLASSISAVREVREAMTELQRTIGKEGGLVAEGRDMGTIVFPHADHKLFVTASLEARAERRYKERIGRGESVSKEEVKKELRKRDEQDKSRPIAPMRPADEAIIIDTTLLNIEQVMEEILHKIGEKVIKNSLYDFWA
jgi:cytidylate kinase